MSETETGAASPPTQARRRLVAIALARRPHLALHELHSILERLDLGVDTPTLVADLDALGYDVDDEEEEEEEEGPAGPVSG
ncbi:hypothetical protein, partial [Iamia sp.]|uniref:hypothetical protein n=1 Tax=Iamia sp. TaxID=2722710 RepID=UPI002D057E54